MKYRHYVPTVAFSIGLGLALVVTVPAQAAVDMFITIGDIKGESSDKAHQDEIDILYWSWGMSNSGSKPGSTRGQVAPSQSKVLVSPSSAAPGSGATGATRQRADVTLGDVVVVKEMDKSSPKLQESMAMGSVNMNPMATAGTATGGTRGKQNAPRSGSGAGSFTFTKYVDKASPQLQQYCGSGQQIPIMMVSSPNKQEPYLTYELTNVMVTSCTKGGGGRPTESISLNYEKIKWSYDKKPAKGKKGKVETTWKVEEGES